MFEFKKEKLRVPVKTRFEGFFRPIFKAFWISQARIQSLAVQKILNCSRLYKKSLGRSFTQKCLKNVLECMF